MDYLVAIVAAGLLVVVRELVRLGVWKATKQVVFALLAANAASYVAAAGVAFGFYAWHGHTVGHRTIVTEALPGFDAVGKLEPGDVILAVNTEAIDGDLVERVNLGQGAPVMLTIERGGQTREVIVEPKRGPEGKSWLLGIRKSIVPVVERDLGEAFQRATTFPIDDISVMIGQVRGSVGGSDDAEVGGPTRIIDEFVVARPSFLARMWPLWMRFGVFAMLAMLIVDVIRFARLTRLARTPPPQ